MNVSQLAVYQIPSDAQKMQKRNTVPFYNRWRALRKRDMARDVAIVDEHPQLADTDISLRSEQTMDSTTNCRRLTVTPTIIAKACATSDPPSPHFLAVEPSTSITNRSYSVSGSTYKNLPSIARPTEVQAEITSSLTATLNVEAIPKRHDVHVAAMDWSRVAFYTSAAPAQATGLSFLANLGDPQKSGTFD